MPKPFGDTRNISVSYLRAFVILLVLTFHSMLAYCPLFPPPPAALATKTPWWWGIPVVDSQRSQIFTLPVAFEDTFFMSLMFFLSGLFLWKSLTRKGTGAFLRDRALRLGLPFLVMAAISPLTFYTTYKQITPHATVGGFVHDWLALGVWPAGPGWFIWVLLAFDCVAAILFVASPRWGEAAGRLASGAAQRPARFFWLMVGVTALVYVPSAVVFTPVAWTSFGPFFFQTSRLLHYFVWFAGGIAVGAWGLDRGLLAADGKLARRWPWWLAVALFVFLVHLVVAVIALRAHKAVPFWRALNGGTFVLTCALSAFLFLALFARFVKTPRRVFDSLAGNCYGMYLIHYPIVAWTQYSLLTSAMPPVVKGALVFATAVVVSWAGTATLRRIPGVARVI